MQRALPGRMSLEVAYVGTKGVDLQASTNENQDICPAPAVSRRAVPIRCTGLRQPSDEGLVHFSFAASEVRITSEPRVVFPELPHLRQSHAGLETIANGGRGGQL